MRIQRLFALKGFFALGWTGLLGVVCTLAVATRVDAQSLGEIPGGDESSLSWEMIDEDAVPMLSPPHQADVSQNALLPEPSSIASYHESTPASFPISSRLDASWSVEADVLALTRNDQLLLRWGVGFAPQTTEFHSDSQTGFRVQVQRTDAPSRDNQETSVMEGSFLFAEDFNEYETGLENWEVRSRLATGEFNRGVQSEVFDVQTSMLLGVRYAYVADEYDEFWGGRLIHDDFTAASNHAGYAQGKLMGDWHRGRFAIIASLAGGAGINAASQEGFELSRPGRPRYESRELSFTTLAELVVKLSMRISEHADVHVGGYGLSLTEVASSRTGFSGPGDLDDARYLGWMIGAQYCF